MFKLFTLKRIGARGSKILYLIFLPLVRIALEVAGRVRTHEKNSGETVRLLGTIVQSIFCTQSGGGIRLNFWK